MDRRTARKHAFTLIFQHQFGGVGLEIEEAFEDYIVWQDLNINKKDRAFIYGAYEGTIKAVGEIDEAIVSRLKKWDINRINKVDLAILRLAKYEQLFTDIPNKVTINEAVELAKTFSSDEAPAFINGILADEKSTHSHTD